MIREKSDATLHLSFRTPRPMQWGERAAVREKRFNQFQIPLTGRGSECGNLDT